MILVFSSDTVLSDCVHVAVDDAVPVQIESDTDQYFRWSSAILLPVSVAIVDCRGEAPDALARLDQVLRRLRGIPVLAVVDRGDSVLAYQVGDRGVSGWIPAPFTSASVRERLLDVLSLPTVVDQAREVPPELVSQLVGGSRRLSDLRRLIVRAAGCDVPIMVCGETGVGKEVVARAIHGASSVADGPFVAANLGALAPGVVESELFGSRRGAFTGALDKPGLFQSSHGGTLFLDEVTEMPVELQPKLLRAVESMEIRPVGGLAPDRIRARIVSATNRSPAILRRTGRFRVDLWYRLAGIVLQIPPLRDRPEDIPALASALLEQAGHGDVRLARSALRLLAEHRWPGNVRELRATLLRSTALSGRRVLRAQDIVLDTTFL